MALTYSVIIPYHRTPSVTCVALHALGRFCTGTVEVLLVHNETELPPSDQQLFATFPAVRVLSAPSHLTGTAALMAAIDVGLAAATRDLVAIIHGDTIVLKPGWDEEVFGYMEQEAVDALGTLAQEANPCRSWHQRIGDIWREIRHKRHPSKKDSAPLMLHFLLTKKSVLTKLDYRFQEHGPIDIRHYTRKGCSISLLSLQEMSALMWHIPNTTRLLRGELNDVKLGQELWNRWRTFWSDPYVLEHFSDLSEPMETAFRVIAAQSSGTTVPVAGAQPIANSSPAEGA
ncbi:MAG: glycosyltransferase [Magnetococcales bacterium]|nr:glycosyltransferase [Magnetococcales bacterium]